MTVYQLSATDTLTVQDLSGLSIDDVGKRFAALATEVARANADAAAERAKRENAEERLDRLNAAYRAIREELELLKRRIFVAKAERINPAQLLLEFADLAAKLDAIARERAEEAATAASGEREGECAAPGDDSASGPSGPKGTRDRSKPKGRRPVVDENHPPDVRIRIEDPSLQGVAREVGIETSYRIGYQRPSIQRIAVDRVKYEVCVPGENPTIAIAPVPRECMRRGLLAPTMIAHILMQKFGSAIPFHRQAKMLATHGIDLDDGTMSRYAEHVGATLGGIVRAMTTEAMTTAFCLATDATGVCIQPSPDERKGARRACNRGHFFVVLADRDHVFFEYTRHHRSEVVCEMFRGFTGYIQADANSVYDAVFRGEALDDERAKSPPKEVACWSHARRGFWECAVTSKEPDAREMLLRMKRVFDEDAKWADLAPDERKQARTRVLRPLVDNLFAWADERRRVHDPTRSRLARAFGYLGRHRDELKRLFDDGRLVLTNNSSESALRTIAIGRNNWMFFGSDDHADAAANLFSLIASCRLHGIDAERYLAEVIHVLPQWPRGRQIELAPRYWKGSRERIVAASERNATVLAEGVGHLDRLSAPNAAE